MAKVTGQISDFGFDPLRSNRLRLSFRHSEPGVSGVSLMTTRPVEVDTEENGYFEADLAPSGLIFPEGFYTVTLEWEEPPSRKVHREVFPGRLWVPPGGGVLSTLLRLPSNPAAVWTGTTAPPNPTPGTWWLNPETGVLKEWN